MSAPPLRGGPSPEPAAIPLPELPRWAGLTSAPRITSNAPLGLAILATLVALFVIDHSWTVSASVGRAARDLSSDIAQVGHGATRLSKPAGYGLLLLLGGGFLLRRGRGRLRIQGPAALCILALLVWATASLLWSTDPRLTLRRGGGLAIMTVTACGLLRQFSLREVILLVSGTSAILLLAGIGAEVLLGTFSPLSEGYRFAGTLHPNHQAVNCALVLMGGLWLATSREAPWSLRWLGWGLATLALAFLFLTRSRSGFVAGTAGASILLLLRSPPRFRVLVPLATVAVGGAAVFLLVNDLMDTPWSVLLLGRSTEQLATLNNRIPLWEAFMLFAADEPLLGYGYGAFISPERATALAADVGGYVLGGPHSAYLSLLLDLGFVGLALFVGCLVVGGVVAARRHRIGGSEAHAFLAGAITFYALNGVLAANSVYPTVDLWFVLLLGAVGFARRVAHDGTDRSRRLRSASGGWG